MLYSSNYVRSTDSRMHAEIVRFIKSMQDPNGFFYHPQWTKELTDSRLSRRARDLRWCTRLLSEFGAKPTYDTPNGVKGDGLDVNGNPVSKIQLTTPIGDGVICAASRVILAATYAEHFESAETFSAYLDRLVSSPNHNFYSIGNEFASQTSQIIERDRQLKAEGKDYSLMTMLISWLNLHQNPDNGLWEQESNYLAVNGLMKISGIYNAAKAEIPNADLAVIGAMNAITSGEEVKHVVDIFNTWCAIENVLSNIRTYAKDRTEGGVTVTANDRVSEIRAVIYKNADRYLKATKEKLSLFQKKDGSFSYNRSSTSTTSQGMPVALPVNEGDVNATELATISTAGCIASVLGINRPPMFTEADRIVFFAIINDKRAEQQSAYGK